MNLFKGIITGALLLSMTVGMPALQAEERLNDGLRVHSLFQDNMVIQRDKTVDVWGWSKSGDQIKLSFAGNTVKGTADEQGKWKVSLPAMRANTEPATMTIESQHGSIRLENILVGDVWVLGGQSNMEWGIGGTQDGNLEVASANFPGIRFIQIPKIFGPELKENFPSNEEYSQIIGQEAIEGDWRICTPETIGRLSAIGYIMTRRLHLAAQVPIGVINTSRGGTTVEAWTPLDRMRKLESPEVKQRLAESDDQIASFDPQAELAKQIKKYEDKVAKLKAEGKDIPDNMTRPTELSLGPAYTHKVPGNCYASVIAPISGFAVKGAIFHQGYNNCFSGVRGSVMYRAVFPEMIKGWRAAFHDDNLPFCILSQCTAGPMQSPDNFLPHIADIGARIREAQYQTFLEFLDAGDTNIGFVSTYDLRHQSFHPRVKIPAGERAAAWALVTQYGMDGKMKWLPPRLKKMKTEGDTLQLKFDQDVGGLSDGRPMEGFAIAGEDMKFQPAEVSHLQTGGSSRKPEYDATTLVLSSPLVEHPVHFRYAWGRNPMGNVRQSYRFGNVVMLPTQRSDNWTNADLLKALTGNEADDPLQIGKSGNNQLKSALAQEDHRRKLAEAKALLAEEEVKTASK
jgi:sialate O-acetylesterase